MKFAKYILLSIVAFLSFQSVATAQDKTPPSGRLVIEHADYASTNSEKKISTLKGSVMLRYTDYEDDSETVIFADEASVDEKTKTTFAKGNISITQDNMSLSGDTLIYKFNERYFEISNVSGVTEGDKELKGKMYFTGERAAGTQRKIKVYHSNFSTCGPHCSNEYHMTSSDISIFPGKRVIARKTAIYLRHTRVMWLPVYIHSLKEDENYRPTFGYNKQEGFFVKNRYPYLARESNEFIKSNNSQAPGDPSRPSDIKKPPELGYIIFNYMEKIGNEYGIDRQYYSDKVGGTGHLIASNNNQKNSGFSNNKMNLTQAFNTGKMTGNFSYNRNSSYNSYRVGSRTNTNTLVTNTSYKQSTSRDVSIKYNLSANRSGTSSENKKFNLDRNVRFSKKLKTTYNFEWSAIQTGTTPENIESFFKTNTSYSGRFYGLNIFTEKSFDPDGDSYTGDNSNVSMIKLPELRFSLNSTLWKKKLPILNSINYVHGRYREGTRNDFRMLRTNQIVATFSKAFKKGKRFTLTPTHTITQKLYSTKDANYLMDFRAAAKYTIDKSRIFTMNFTRRGNSGGSPYAGDLGGEQISLNGQYVMTKYSEFANAPGKRKKATEFSMGTGYNYKAFQFNPLNLIYYRAISHNAALNLTGGRNLNTNIWSVTNSTLQLGRKNTTLSLTATWDTEKDFDLQTLTFNTVHKRRNGWKVSVRGSYKHRDPDEIIKDIVATKTRCCTELEFFYNTVRKEFKFQYSIMAFPSKKFGFTQGDQGLELDSGLTEFKSD